MIKGILKGTSLAFIIFGIYQTIVGNPAGGIFLIAGIIMDLQAGQMDVNERLTALENKGKDKTDAA